MAQVRIYSTPSYLYRYRSISDLTLDREVAALVEGHIYCPRFSDMNDPMEGAHRLSLASFAKGSGESRRDVLGAREKLGIASLSEVVDHEPMWAHYADNFRGICIAFSTRKLIAGLPEDIDLIRMAYNEKPPILPPNKTTVVDKAKLTLATKTVRWSSEREWRVIAPRVGRAQYANPNIVTRVYLGARIALAHETRIRQEMRVLKVPVAKMKIDKYAIEFTGAD